MNWYSLGQSIVIALNGLAMRCQPTFNAFVTRESKCHRSAIAMASRWHRDAIAMHMQGKIILMAIAAR